VKIVGSVFNIALGEYIWVTHFSPKGAALTSFLSNIDKKNLIRKKNNKSIIEWILFEFNLSEFLI
jgi:hypothetical protein